MLLEIPDLYLELINVKLKKDIHIPKLFQTHLKVFQSPNQEIIGGPVVQGRGHRFDLWSWNHQQSTTGTKILHAVAQLSLCGKTPEPASNGAQTPQLEGPCDTTTEPIQHS